MENINIREIGLSIKDILVEDGIHPVENPQAFLTVGQPGAGKTTLAEIVLKEMGDNAVFINGDDYRHRHPNYKELVKKYKDDAVLHTQKFAGQLTEYMIDNLSQEHFNLIIEGTLRTKEVPLRTKDLLEKRGYTVSLEVISVRPEISFLSTIKRYIKSQQRGSIPRMTPKEHHDLVVDSIVKNLNYLYKHGDFSEIKIYNREKECLYDSNLTPNKNPADLLRKEFSRQLSSEEIKEIHKDFDPYAGKQKVSAIIASYAKKIKEKFQSKDFER